MNKVVLATGSDFKYLEKIADHIAQLVKAYPALK